MQSSPQLPPDTRQRGIVTVRVTDVTLRTIHDRQGQLRHQNFVRASGRGLSWADGVLAADPAKFVVFTRHQQTCVCGRCGDAPVTLDHLVSKNQGGSLTDPTNLVPLSQSCNSSKCARDFLSWARNRKKLSWDSIPTEVKRGYLVQTYALYERKGQLLDSPDQFLIDQVAELMDRLPGESYRRAVQQVVSMWLAGHPVRAYQEYERSLVRI